MSPSVLPSSRVALHDDVLLLIFSMLHSPEQPANLAPLALLCKYWEHVVSPILYGTIEIGDVRSPRFKLLYRTLVIHESDARRSLVKSLEIGIPPEEHAVDVLDSWASYRYPGQHASAPPECDPQIDISDLISVCPNLKCLSMTFDGSNLCTPILFNALMSVSLQSFSLSVKITAKRPPRGFFGTEDMLFRLLCRWCDLCELSLEGWMASPRRPRNPDVIRGEKNALFNLKKITLLGRTFYDGLLTRLASAAPNITTLMIVKPRYVPFDDRRFADVLHLWRNSLTSIHLALLRRPEERSLPAQTSAAIARLPHLRRLMADADILAPGDLREITSGIEFLVFGFSPSHVDVLVSMLETPGRLPLLQGLVLSDLRSAKEVAALVFVPEIMRIEMACNSAAVEYACIKPMSGETPVSLLRS